MAIKINPANPASTVQTINHALSEISKTFGSDARQLEEMQAKLDLVLGEGATRINSKGQLKLRNTGAVRERLASNEAVEGLSDLPTAKDYMREAMDRTRTDRGGAPVTKAEAVEHEAKVDRIKRSAEQIKQILSDLKSIGYEIPSSMTYDQLDSLLDQAPWLLGAHEAGYSVSSTPLFDESDFDWDGEWVTDAEDFEGGLGDIERL